MSTYPFPPPPSGPSSGGGPKMTIQLPVTLPVRQKGYITRRERDAGVQGLPRHIFDNVLLPKIAEGEDCILFPMEFILLLLHRAKVTIPELDTKLGYAPQYVEGMFSTGVNNGSHTLPRPLQEKMAALTGTDVHFWTRLNYNASEANEMTLDMKKDISSIIHKWKHFSERTKHAHDPHAAPPPSKL